MTIPAVPGRVSSPTFIGRREQLDELTAALDGMAADPRRIVLVHGEAGIGKTRLLDEFAKSLAARVGGVRPAVVVRGSCLELAGGGMPFAPILDVLDGLAAAIPETSEAATALRAELAGSPTGESAEQGRGRVFVATLDLLRAAAADTDLVIALDDLHWADRSTLELTSFLARRLAPARVLVLLVYRSDELHRRHPLVPVLAEIGRTSVIAEIALRPLDADGIRDQVRAILDAEPEPATAERIVELADGNPFHAEELLALDPGGGRIPRLLRDVLLARLERLGDPTVELLGRAAIVGRDVDEGLLAAISDAPLDAVREALREAVASHILEAHPDGRRYRFRHALLREAVHDDLLPADRLTLHRRTAEALAAHLGHRARTAAAATAELAYHWFEAGDREMAFPAFVEAGETAAAAYAWAEASSAFERAAILVREGAVTIEPIALAELEMRSAGLADLAGDFRRAIALGRAAIGSDDGRDPLRSGRLWATLHTIANDAGEWDLSRLAGDRGVELIPADTPSLDRAFALGCQAGEWMTKGDCRAAVRLADETLAMCAQVGAPDVEVSTLAVRAMACAVLGRADEALRAHRAAVAGLDRPDVGRLDTLGVVLSNGGLTLLLAGRFEEVIRFTDVATARSMAYAAGRSWDPWLHPSAAYAAFLLGRWDEAADRLGRIPEAEVLGHPSWQTIIWRGLLDGARGHRSAVEAQAPAAAAAPWDPYYVGSWDVIRSLAASWDSDPRTAADLADRGLERLIVGEDVTALAHGVTAAAWAHADLADRGRAARRGGDVEAALARLSELGHIATALARGDWLDDTAATDWIRAMAATTLAEVARAAGRKDLLGWQAAIQVHEAAGSVPDAAYARYRLAEAALASDDRATAREALAAAAAFAASVGALPLTRRIGDLARRARLDLGDEAGTLDEPATAEVATHDPWGLSTREREVLHLVSAGRTNRQIGEALFISEKTASVHVTHILDKLGVSSRTEAALLAGKVGLDGPPG